MLYEVITPVVAVFGYASHADGNVVSDTGVFIDNRPSYDAALADAYGRNALARVFAPFAFRFIGIRAHANHALEIRARLYGGTYPDHSYNFV